MVKKICLWFLFSPWLLMAQPDDSSTTPALIKNPDPFRPVYFLMPTSAITFEEGRAITLTTQQAEQALNAAYHYVEQLGTNASNIIIQGRNTSLAQLFGREANHQRYIYINVFPRSSDITSQPLRTSEYRHQGGGAAYWKIRYDIDRGQCFGFSANLAF